MKKAFILMTILIVALATVSWAQWGAAKIKGELEIAGYEFENMIERHCYVSLGSLSCGSVTEDIRCELKEDAFDRVKLDCEIW